MSTLVDAGVNNLSFFEVFATSIIKYKPTGELAGLPAAKPPCGPWRSR